MKILHLSDTTLSGSPYRISELINKYTPHDSTHIVWRRKIFHRVFPVDMVGEETDPYTIDYWLDWADIIHYHNVYRKQEIFKTHKVPNKPSVIQVHSPRDYFDAKAVVESKLPIAVIAQYHVRQWPELKYIVPNVVDIDDPSYIPINRNNMLPIVSYAPSNGNGKGWNDKGYGKVMPYLKRLKDIDLQKIFGRPFIECLQMKRVADIGIDDINTGSYHLSALEYLALGIATICYTDPETEKVVKDLTGSNDLPFIHAGRNEIATPLRKALLNHKELGKKSRTWMETYWNPKILCDHYVKMYEDLS